MTPGAAEDESAVEVMKAARKWDRLSPTDLTRAMAEVWHEIIDDDKVRLFLFSQFFCFASTVIPCRGFIRGGVDECCAREETVCVREKSV